MAASQTPLELSRWFLRAASVRLFVHYGDRIPPPGPIVVASNHRSFMDAFALMAALERPIRFACHHYFGQVPILRDIVDTAGCFPLEEPSQRQHVFLKQGSELLQQREAVGVFPEGAKPMVARTRGDRVGEFHRGFAHLALRAPVDGLAVLPVAIVSEDEQIYEPVPVRLLSVFDPTEPLFDREGWHPMVIYRHLTMRVGRPYWITAGDREGYSGKHARAAVNRVADFCREEIASLLD